MTVILAADLEILADRYDAGIDDEFVEAMEVDIYDSARTVRRAVIGRPDDRTVLAALARHAARLQGLLDAAEEDARTDG